MRGGLRVPRPSFPYTTDSWRELFRVYDSTQATLSEDVDPDADTLLVVTRDLSRGLDVWGENGFATIGDEVVYYDSVKYVEISNVREIEPHIFEGPDQSYYLSKSQEEFSSLEILSDLSLGAEASVANPDIILENTITLTDLGVTDPSASLLQISGPFSVFGRLRIGSSWSYFATLGSGGLLGQGCGVYPEADITSITLSSSGITIHGSSVPDLVETNYYFAPRRYEPVVGDLLSVYLDGEKVIDGTEILSTEINSFTLNELTGILDISWNSNQRKLITVDYQRGRIARLENCIRGYNTVSTHHSAGDTVSGYVMAEHHNNLVRSMLGVEELIGADSSEDIYSIDWMLRMLEGLEPEYNPECPNGQMEMEILEEETATQGPLVRFTLSSTGAAGSRLFFGDGRAEENISSTTHQYARGSQFSPSAAFYNDVCEEYSTSPGAIEVEIELPSITLPVIPAIEIPPFDFTLDISPIEYQAPPDLELVTLGFPTGFSFPEIPSIIRLEVDPPFPTFIEFEEITLPTQIDLIYYGPTMITITGIPTMITVTGMPSEIVFTGLSVPTQIEFTGQSIPSEINISLSISVDTSAISGNCFKLVPCTI